MTAPLRLTGLQDWYLRACDGECDETAGVPKNPREAGLAWCGLLSAPSASSEHRRSAPRSQQSRRESRGTRHL